MQRMSGFWKKNRIKAAIGALTCVLLLNQTLLYLSERVLDPPMLVVKSPENPPLATAFEEGLLICNRFEDKKGIAPTPCVSQNAATCYAAAPSRPCRPRACCCYTPCCACDQLYISASLLYWRPSIEGLECEFPTFLITNTSNGSVTTSAVTRSNRTPAFEWNLGYRVGLGYDFACSCWELGFFWTHYHGGAHRVADDTPNFGKWQLKYDVQDLIVDYTLYFNRCFMLAPYAGLRGAEISQKLHAHFITTNIETDGGVTLYDSDRKDTQKFWGLGPELGLFGAWNMGCGFSFFGGVGGALLYGHTALTSQSSDLFPLFFELSDGNRSKFNIQPCLDLEVGIGWNTCICKKLVFFELALEHHGLYYHGQIGCSSAPLNLDGLTFTAGLQF